MLHLLRAFLYGGVIGALYYFLYDVFVREDIVSLTVDRRYFALVAAGLCVIVAAIPQAGPWFGLGLFAIFGGAFTYAFVVGTRASGMGPLTLRDLLVTLAYLSPLALPALLGLYARVTASRILRLHRRVD